VGDKEPKRVSRVKVTREESDEVFEATATEVLRKPKAKTPLHMTQAERDLKNQQAEEIVLRKKRGGK
jgi:hypothetical protein